MAFAKRDAFLDAKNPSKDAKEGPLNKTPELTVQANSFASQVFPVAGELILGEAGIEFNSLQSAGFVQIPWRNVEQVMVDVVGKNYVRSITISTNEVAPLEFVLSHGDEVVRVIARHLGREKLVAAPKNFKRIGEKIKRMVARPFARFTKGESDE